MKPMIIYKSNTGHTKEYADMLSKSLDCTALPLDRMSKATTQNYDTLIFGGWVRASKIIGFNSFIKKLPKNTNQRIVVFAVGANGKTDDNTKELISKNIEANMVSYPLFYMQGGFDPDKLNLFLRKMLQGVEKSIKKKQATEPEKLTQGDKEFLEFFQESHNNVEQENLSELLNYMQENM